MHSKRKFKAFLGFNWHWYLIIFLSTLFVFYFLFETLRTPGYDEKVVIFIGSKHVEVERLESDLYKGFEGTKIEEIFVDYSNPKDSDYSIVFNTRGTVNTDILILTSDYILEGDYSNFFAKIDDKLISQYQIDDSKLFKDSDNFVYGIDVTDYLKNYINTNETYYLFFNKKSEKIAYLNENSSVDYALVILENILNER